MRASAKPAAPGENPGARARGRVARGKGGAEAMPAAPGWRGKRVAVVGLGERTNQPLTRYLARKGAHVTVFDRQTRAQLGPRYDELAALGVDFSLGPAFLRPLPEFPHIFFNPGFRLTLPEVAAARAAGAEFWNETRLFLRLCRAQVIGVTGSAGKTTTTALLGQMLRAATGDRAPADSPLRGRPVYVGGNIGRALIDEVEDIPPEAIVVLELSSFQLQLCDRSPRIAVVTNLRPNHLDVHASYAEYADAKRNIFRFQRPRPAAVGGGAEAPAARRAGRPRGFVAAGVGGDWCVLNAQQPECAALAAECPAGVAWFDRRGEVARGSFLRGETVYLRDGAGERAVCELGAFPLPGEHNVDNLLAAVAAAGLAGAPVESMAAAASAFRGIEHRLELVGEAGGARYYNDSKATSPDEALAALRTLPGPLILIAGGSDKGIPFDDLAAEIVRRVRVLVLTGQTAERIAAAVGRAGRSPAGEDAAGGASARAPIVLRAADMADAVARAAAAARPGDTVVLSPACASFDRYRDFEERGRHFKRLVGALPGFRPPPDGSRG